MNDRDKIKQELLEELKKEYQLVPIKEAKFTVSDILNKYYDDICDYMNHHKTRNEFEILIGTKKKFKKESPDAYELTELIFIHNQLTIRGYADDLWELVSKKRECYNNSIGVLSFLALDEGTDKNETKILKKAIAILEERRDMDCDPVDPKILQENHELNQQWKEHL